MNRPYHFLRIAALMLIVLVSVGCAKKVPTAPAGNTLPQSQILNNATVQDIIIKAGHELGWIIVPINETSLQATLKVRSHRLICEIHHDKERYTINYKSSENLNYKEGKIHRQYRNWVLRLQDSIDRDIAFHIATHR